MLFIDEDDEEDNENDVNGDETTLTVDEDKGNDLVYNMEVGGLAGSQRT